MALRNLIFTAAAALFAAKAGAVDNGLAITPQMGCGLILTFIETDTDDAQGTIGMLWAATSPRTSFSKPQS
jgi:hypothetical protein